MFRLLRLKPPHGWNAVAWELAIVAIGVLMALAAQQAAENWSWRQKADGAWTAIEHELALNAGVFEERALLADCIDSKGEQLDAVLRAARVTHRLPEVDQIMSVPTRPVVTGAWRSAVADGTVAHFSGEQRDQIDRLYPTIEDFTNRMSEEQALYSQLRLVEKARGPVSEPLLAELSMTLARMRQADWFITSIAKQNLDWIEEMGIRPDYTFVFDKRATREQLIHKLRCKPIMIDGRPAPTPQPAD